jgi:hypothetical protein
MAKSTMASGKKIRLKKSSQMDHQKE